MFLFFLALVMIWIAWGFWAFLGALGAKIVITTIFKPKYEDEVNWGGFLAAIAIYIVGILAVDAKWHEPAYTAAAVVIAVLLLVTEK